MDTYYAYNTESTQSVSETLKISGGQIQLRHIPKQSSVTIPGFIETNALVVEQGKFRVDYFDANGEYRECSRKIYFNAADNGKTVSVGYSPVGTPVTAQDMNEIKNHMDYPIRFRGVMDDFPADKQVGDVVFKGSGKSFIWSSAEWLPFKIGSGGSGSAGGLSDDIIQQIAKARKAWLPFNKKMSTDVYNGSVFAFNTEKLRWIGPVDSASGIRDGKAYFDGQDYIDGSKTFSWDVGSFTVDFWAQMDSDAKSYAGLFDLQTQDMFIRRRGTENQKIEIKAYHSGDDATNFFYILNLPGPLTERFHFALVYNHPEKFLRLFFNGSCFWATDFTFGNVTSSTGDFVEIARVNYFGDNRWKGYMEHFRYIEAALWTENFTPPDSPEVYAAQMGTYPD